LWLEYPEIKVLTEENIKQAVLKEPELEIPKEMKEID